ncbi:nucleotide-binding domain-containing protein [Vagococcus fluvialis]|uniref:nucleotide-binding domain-containing protein n=1 Tax=Vagococcus fluvialis TaxID=2738 RepID=UPI003B5931B5
MRNNIENIFFNNLNKENLSTQLKESLVHSRDYSFSKSIVASEKELLSIANFPNNVFSDKIGTHPDFIKEDSLPKNQYICSMFLDIKGSTRLALKYDLETVQKIKNAVITTGIEIIRYFGGHIHRIQGDAIFAFTGHSKISKSDAIIQALNAASVIQYMNKSFLKDYFENTLRVKPLKIRIGIDFGDNDNVLWSKYGIDDINEVTVTSLHADLSSKLQNKASSNSIMIGENIFSYLQLPEELLNDIYVSGSTEKKDYYIMSYKSFNYKMKDFNWSKYLERISHFESYNDDFEIKCYYVDGGIKKQYFSDRALGKEINLIYQIEANDQQIEKVSNVQWNVSNAGVEAIEAEQTNFTIDEEEISEDDKNNLRCCIDTSFNGLHYMSCKIQIDNHISKTKYFSLFVNDDNLSKNYLKKIDLESK